MSRKSWGEIYTELANKQRKQERAWRQKTRSERHSYRGHDQKEEPVDEEAENNRRIEVERWLAEKHQSDHNELVAALEAPDRDKELNYVAYLHDEIHGIKKRLSELQIDENATREFQELTWRIAATYWLEKAAVKYRLLTARTKTNKAMKTLTYEQDLIINAASRKHYELMSASRSGIEFVQREYYPLYLTGDSIGLLYEEFLKLYAVGTTSEDHVPSKAEFKDFIERDRINKLTARERNLLSVFNLW